MTGHAGGGQPDPAQAVRKVLTIAGSDCSGGAGIQADLKTFSRLKVYGMSVITALTAQNTTGVSEVMEVPAEFVACQLDAVFTDLPPDAVKTGMLRSRAIIETVVTKLKEHKPAAVVVDPVMVSKSGSRLLNPDAVDILRRILLPLSLLVTPNLEEAEKLTGQPVRSVEDMEESALRIHAMGARYVLVKGGHLADDPIDLLFDGNDFRLFRSQRIPTRDSHGTGCVLSAAITAYLALGKNVTTAVQLGKEFVTEAISKGLRIGGGQGPCDPVGLGMKGCEGIENAPDEK